MSSIGELDRDTFRALERGLRFIAKEMSLRYPHTSLSKEDLIQIGWLGCEEALGKYDPSKAGEKRRKVSFCLAYALHRMIDEIRKDPVVRIPSRKQVDPSEEVVQRQLASDQAILPVDEELPDDIPAPDEVIHKKLLASALQKCLDQLPPDTRVLLALRFYMGEKLENLARAYGVTPQAISQKIKRSLSTLRKCLEEKNITVEDIF